MPRSRKSRYADDYRQLLTLLVAEREKRDITQVQLAKRMKTSQSMLSKMERGVVRIDLADLLDYLDGVGGHPLEFVRSYIKEIGWKAKR